MKVLGAFLRRDILIQLSYSFRLFLKFAGFAMSIVFIFFLSRMMGESIRDYLHHYKSDYFSYAVIGISISTFISTGLYSYSSQIRAAQVEGTLEILLLAPVSIYTILTGNSLWSFILAFSQSFIMLTVVTFLVPTQLSIPDILLVLAVLALTFSAFLSLGMISAAFILVFKQGNPVNMIFGTSSYFLGGIFFPVEVMPELLQRFSRLLPAYHSAYLAREIFLVDAAARRILSSFLYLGMFTLIAGISGVFLFRIALRTAKKNGSLIQF